MCYFSIFTQATLNNNKKKKKEKETAFEGPYLLGVPCLLGEILVCL